ncbi:hypothetical protein D5086_016985 [Populus alba]|uniref:Uncharacterized protein n=1 Tax=Populus alba TaxID=43335 RepID=A0ACC4BVI7_POPAL
MGNPDNAGMSGLIGDEEGKCIAGFHGYIGWTTNIMVEADSLEAVHLIADWALSCAICWLNFWLSILTHRGSETTKEKEIVVDINCNNNSIEQTIVQEEDSDAIEFQNHDGNETKVCFCPVSATSGSESQTGSPKVVKSTNKDAPEKGTGEGIQNSEESTKQMIQSTISSEETSSIEQMIHSTVSGEETSTKGETNESMKQKECIAEEETEEARASKEAAGEGGDNTAVIEEKTATKAAVNVLLHTNGKGSLCNFPFEPIEYEKVLPCARLS